MKWLARLLNRTPAQPPLPTARKIALPPDLDPALRSLAPRAGDPPETRVGAICQAPDKTLALTWLADLEGDAHLGEVAIQARQAEIRYAAAQRIDDGAVLERVAQASRDKDKRVYRHCGDLLKQRRQAAAREQRIEAIAEAVRALLASAPLPHTPLTDLSKELAALGEGGDAWAACNDLVQQALARLRQEAQARRDLQGLQAQASALASECAEATWPWRDALDDWRARLDGLLQARDAQPTWLAEPARALHPALDAIASRLDVCAVETERAAACERFLDALEAEPAAVDDPTAAWRALDKPTHAEARHALEQRWQTLAPSAPVIEAVATVAEATVSETPKPPPRPKPTIDQDALRALLERLEQAIAQGHLHDADGVAGEVKALLAGQHPRGALESRLHRLLAELETLRGWARWGTGQAREHLIAAARELLEGEREVDELARAIPALREEWKRLNALSPSTRAQWESFDAALEQAYQPVAAHRLEVEARQAEARLAREALCAEWEAELAGIDWEQADYRQIEKTRSEWIAHWRGAARIGPRDERLLRKRFDALIAGIDGHLESARAEERTRREHLIAQAEALVEQTDPRAAMSEAKTLNQRWSQQPRPIRLHRGEEQKLWHRFRAACDAVFARGQAQRDEQSAQRQARNAARRQLLDAFASALATAEDDAVKRLLTRFNADWQSHPADSRDADESLETRLRELRQQAQTRLDQAHRKQRLANYELLARKAALAAQVEAAVLADHPPDAALAKVRQTWDSLPPLHDHGERLLAERLAQATAITPSALAAGRETRAALLLDLEIALGLPSPEIHAEARRERQLERLRNRFTSEGAALLEPDALLIRCYATAAEPDPDHDQRLEAVGRHLAERVLTQSAH